MTFVSLVGACEGFTSLGRFDASVHVQLAPGESLLPGTKQALDALFAKPEVAAVLVPLVPQGDAALPRAARKYLAAWDGRFLHTQNFYAPAARVATRAALDDVHNADAAPALADALAKGARIEALREPGLGVATRIADDLGAWAVHFRAEGAAWAALATRDARFAGFAPAPWWRHNVRQMPRRVIEIAQATRGLSPLTLLLHATRESAFSRGATLRPAHRQ